MDVDFNNTVVLNPSYPNVYNGGSRCSYPVYRQSRHICQLRIDFLAFSLAQPSGDGICATDFFTVEGGVNEIPKICGENTGQHLYVEVARKTRIGLPISIIVSTTGSFVFNRRWQIRVTQIKCLSKFRGLISKF